MATSSGLLLTAAMPTMLTSHHHLSNLAPQQMPALHQFGPASAGNLPPSLHPTTQFLSNHNAFPFAMATNPVTIASNAAAINASHFLSKSDANVSLLNSYSVAKTPSNLLQTTAASFASSTSTVATATSTTPMAIITPQKSLHNGPPPLAPTLSATIPMPCPMMPQPLTGTFLSNNVQLRDASTATQSGNGPSNAFNQLKLLPDQTPSHATTIAAPLAKRQPDVVEATIPTIRAMAPLSSPTGAGKRDAKQIAIAPTFSLPDGDILASIQPAKVDEMPTPTAIVAAIEMSTLTFDSLKVQTVLETEGASSAMTESSKSPILSQPKTIRFPANNSKNGTRRSDNRIAGCCYWDGCKTKCESSSNLHDHLQTQHVNTQAGPFTCSWADCKVKGRESCSRKWLERHVLSHGGSKVFKCIFEKCRMRFGSQVSAIGLHEEHPF